eukprot:COSAG02_NODE_223_length_28346_cov_91.381846_2_plen_201_part_00
MKDKTGGARHSPRVSGAVLNLILGHPEVSGFAVRNAKCPVSHREMRNVQNAKWINSEHMSADSAIYALMESLSELSITQDELRAEISAGFIEGDPSHASGVSWQPSVDGSTTIDQTLTQRCLDGTHSVLFEEAPGAGSLQSVGISPLALVHCDNLHCTPGEVASSAAPRGVGLAEERAAPLQRAPRLSWCVPRGTRQRVW